MRLTETLNFLQNYEMTSNQVYFHGTDGGRTVENGGLRRLNPFMNQVYFHAVAGEVKELLGRGCLNPFMNQVYFHNSFSHLSQI